MSGRGALSRDQLLPRAARLSAPECWALWRTTLDRFFQHAAGAEDSGGEPIEFPPETLHDFAALARVPFPVEGVCGEQMASAFRLQAQALIDVALPLRRVAVAEGVLGSIRALRSLVSAEMQRQTDVWQTRLGAGG